MNAFAARYLYGLENPLEPDLVEAYITALVRVAQANGIVEAESRILAGIADALGAPPFLLTTLMGRRDETDFQTSLLRLRTRPSMVVMLLRDAMLIAHADGWISEEEKDVLAGVMKMLGLDEAQRARAAAACEQLEDLRHLMAAL
jgi:tellurite resistance protein